MSQNDDDSDPGRMLVYGVLACWVVIGLLIWALW